MLRDEWNVAAIEADEANEATPYPGDWRVAQDWLWRWFVGYVADHAAQTSSSSTCPFTSRNWRHQSCRGRNTRKWGRCTC